MGPKGRHVLEIFILLLLNAFTDAATGNSIGYYNSFPSSATYGQFARKESFCTTSTFDYDPGGGQDCNREISCETVCNNGPAANDPSADNPTCPTRRECTQHKKQECNVVYETVCPSSSNYYSFPKRRKKRTVALVRNLIRAKQNHWSRKKQFVRNLLGINNRRGRVQAARRRPYQSTTISRPMSTISRPVHYQPQATPCNNVGKKKCAWVTVNEVCDEVPDQQCLERREERKQKCKRVCKYVWRCKKCPPSSGTSTTSRPYTTTRKPRPQRPTRTPRPQRPTRTPRPRPPRPTRSTPRPTRPPGGPRPPAPPKGPLLILAPSPPPPNNPLDDNAIVVDGRTASYSYRFKREEPQNRLPVGPPKR